jgi:hypothetical protein
LGDLARVPVIATFLAQIAELDDPETTKHGLYRQYLEKFLSRSWKPHLPTLTSAQFRVRLDLAADAAWAMATWHSEENIDQWIDHVRLGQLQDAVPESYGSASGPTRADWYQGVQELCTLDGLLVPHSGLEKDQEGHREVRWLHRTLQEHLAGLRLTRLLQDRRDQGLAKIRHLSLRPHWDEALDHAAGLIADAHLADPVLEDLWEWHAHGDTPNQQIQSQIIRFSAHARLEQQVKTISIFASASGEWYGVNGLSYSLKLFPEQAYDRYFESLEMPLDASFLLKLTYRISDVLRAGIPSTKGLEILQTLSATSWWAQLALWNHLDRPVSLFDYLTLDALPPRSNFPSNLEPRDMAETCAAMLRAARGQILASKRARDLLATGHPRAAEMLRTAMGGCGIEAKFVESFARYSADDETAFINSLHDREVLEFCRAGSPPYIAYLVAANREDAATMSGASDLSPWAKAGLASRWAAFPEASDLPSWEGWNSGRAERAIDCLASRQEPTAVQMEEFWRGAQYLLERRIPTRITQLIDFYRLNDTGVWPRFWWADTAFRLRGALSKAFTWEDIMDQIEGAEVFDDGDADSFIYDVLDKLNEKSRAGEVVTYVRRRRHRNWTDSQYGVPNVSGVGSELIAIARRLPPSDAAGLMRFIEYPLRQDDRLWQYVDDILHFVHAAPLAHVPGRRQYS